MLDHLDDHARAAGGGSDRRNSSNTGGSVNETPTYTSTNRESGRNPLSERFLHWRIDDGRAGARRYDGNGNSPDAELQIIVSSPQTGNRTAQPPIPLSINDSLMRTHASAPQADSYLRLLPHDSQVSLHKPPARESDDEVFAIPQIPQIPQKSQQVRTKREEAAIRTETHRGHSIDKVPDGDNLEVNGDHRQPSLRRSEVRKETSPGNTSRLLACPYLKSAPGAVNHRCKGAAYQTIHRLKEHLYRAHQQRPYCCRCGEIFPHPKDVEEHLIRPEGICDIVRGFSVEGLTAEQIQKLKSKKRKPGVTTDEEKWQDIFKIVFPDATNRPDPYYCQTDVDSIFSNIPSESEERFFTMLEPVFGPLEKSKRQKVLDTCKCFFAERMHQSRWEKALPQNGGDVVCPDEPCSSAPPRENVAPESEGNNPRAHCPPAENRVNDQDSSVVPTTSVTKTVEHEQSGALQKELECSLFNLANETIVSNIRPGNDENIGTGNRLPNYCPNVIGRSSTPSLAFANNTGNFVFFHEPKNSFNADQTPVNFDFDFHEDWEGPSPFGPASWATGSFHA